MNARRLIESEAEAWRRFEADKARHGDPHRPRGSRPPVLHSPDGKRWQFSQRHGQWLNISVASSAPGTYQNSVSMSRNRNLRGRSFGRKDNFSLRDRGWPWALRHGKPS